MQKIKKLSIHEAQKIAAGEVVERPANVVKELLENALDAGATTITLHILDAGKKLIRIIDNGCGMSADDARICFDQYATSKIVSVDDLPTIHTFGFRGEALASIAAVSKITLLTKEAAREHGTKITVECNAIVSQETAACNTGTDITVADLLYNVPARKKFLKASETEWRAIVHLITAVSLAHLAVHIKVFHNERLAFNCPPSADSATRLSQVWDSQAANMMVNIVAEKTDDLAREEHGQGFLHKHIRVTGMISRHQYNRYDRTNMLFLVNSRWVKNQKLSNAVMKGYGNALPQGKFPACIIHVAVDSVEVDINIHPRKEEVAFLHPRIVEAAITEAVKKTLEFAVSESLKRAIVMHPSIHSPKALTSFVEHSGRVPVDALVTVERASERKAIAPEILISLQKHLSIEKNPMPLVVPADNVAQQKLQENFPVIPITSHDTPEIIGCYDATYILLQTEEGLMMMDQHAAHERVLYEKFAASFNDVATVTNMFPEVIQMTRDDVKILAPYLPLIAQHGVVAELFGEDQLVVSATPVHCKNVHYRELLQEIVGWLVELQHLDQEQLVKNLHEKIHAQMACKAAVKAGDVLSREHMTQLVKDLFNTNNRFACPHGRPTTWLISLHDIEKKFRRKL